MKRGFFGGTFNPPHLGHVRAAEAAARQLELESLCIIPAGTPPHKKLP
ncbi:MAG: adenylyltransferase/cytidyltransferase family protein, partial [Oscillospiraceae bacterium]|nr:adenylyltransferase/cytidyltransferase family protein [Oscillospiraceae bacterium]